MNSATTVYNYGTHVYYEGDDSNRPGFGSITDAFEDSGLGELVMEVTLEDGRVFYDITPQDFEDRTVNGNNGGPEFRMIDAWEEETDSWDGVSDEGVVYSQENDVLRYFL